MIFGMNSLEVVVWVLGILVVGGGISFGGGRKTHQLTIGEDGATLGKGMELTSLTAASEPHAATTSSI